MIKAKEGETFNFYADNRCNMFIINQMVSKSKNFMKEVKMMHSELWRAVILLEAQYITIAR